MCPTGNVKISQLVSKLLKLIKGSYKWAESKVNFNLYDLKLSFSLLVISS
jgi:hypothetical protein